MVVISMDNWLWEIQWWEERGECVWCYRIYDERKEKFYYYEVWEEKLDDERVLKQIIWLLCRKILMDETCLVINSIKCNLVNKI
jgi:hypothetical protein